MDSLAELQRDAISELVNIGIGKAASTLSDMTGEEIGLSVPKCEFVLEGRPRLSDELGPEVHLTAIRQSFSGEFFGESVLLFPEQESLELVHLTIDDAIPADAAAEMAQGALVELGNVVLNTFLESIGNELDISIPTSFPVLTKIKGCGELFRLSREGGALSKNMTVSIHVDFAIRTKNINGYVILLLDLSAIDNFLRLVNSYISRIA